MCPDSKYGDILRVALFGSCSKILYGCVYLEKRCLDLLTLIVSLKFKCTRESQSWPCICFYFHELLRLSYFVLFSLFSIQILILPLAYLS